MTKYFLTAILCVTLFACNTKKDYNTVFSNPAIYSKTVHELNSVVMGNNFSPIVASRNYTYANIAGYEVIAAGYPDQYNSLAGQLKDLKKLPKPESGKIIN